MQNASTMPLREFPSSDRDMRRRGILRRSYFLVSDPLLRCRTPSSHGWYVYVPRSSNRTYPSKSRRSFFDLVESLHIFRDQIKQLGLFLKVRRVFQFLRNVIQFLFKQLSHGIWVLGRSLWRRCLSSGRDRRCLGDPRGAIYRAEVVFSGTIDFSFVSNLHGTAARARFLKNCCPFAYQIGGRDNLSIILCLGQKKISTPTWRYWFVDALKSSLSWAHN